MPQAISRDDVRADCRADVERLLSDLYAARTTGALEPLCALFAPDAVFKISGSSDGKPIALSAEEVRSWLTVLVKTFRNHAP